LKVGEAENAADPPRFSDAPPEMQAEFLNRVNVRTPPLLYY